MTTPAAGAAGSADMPDYAPIPRSALGPALNDQRYYVGRVVGQVRGAAGAGVW